MDGEDFRYIYPADVSLNNPDWYEEAFVAEITAVTGTAPYLYSWKEKQLDPSGTGYIDCESPRIGSSTAQMGIELNNVKIAVGALVYIRLRGVQQGNLVFEIDTGFTGTGQTLSVVTNVCPVFTTIDFGGSVGSKTLQTGTVVQRRTITLPPGAIVDDTACETDPVECCMPATCCSGALPGVIYLTIASTDCSCLADTYTMTWSPTVGRWISAESSACGSAGSPLIWHLSCADNVMTLYGYCTGSVLAFTDTSTIVTCDPLYVLDVNIGNPFGYCGCPVNTTITWTVTD